MVKGDIESYEGTPHRTHRGLYRGTLYLNVAPDKRKPDEEES